MEAASGRKQDAEKLNKKTGVPSGAPVFNYFSFFFRGPRGFEKRSIEKPPQAIRSLRRRGANISVISIRSHFAGINARPLVLAEK